MEPIVRNNWFSSYDMFYDRRQYKQSLRCGQLKLEKEVWEGPRKVNLKAKEKARRLRKEAKHHK